MFYLFWSIFFFFFDNGDVLFRWSGTGRIRWLFRTCSTSCSCWILTKNRWGIWLTMNKWLQFTGIFAVVTRCICCWCTTRCIGISWRCIQGWETTTALISTLFSSTSISRWRTTIIFKSNLTSTNTSFLFRDLPDSDRLRLSFKKRLNEICSMKIWKKRYILQQLERVSMD